jgi:hypothetical protein
VGHMARLKEDCERDSLQETEELEHDLLEILNEEDDKSHVEDVHVQHRPIPHHHHPGRSKLACLNDEITLRTLCFLSAQDLCALAQTSKHFSYICQANVVWRRLYALRWDPQTVEDEHLADVDILPWYQLYKEKDIAELLKVLQDAAPDEIQVIYKHMIAARRTETPTLASQPLPDDTYLFSSPATAGYQMGTMQHTIQAFRKTHGLPLGSGVQEPCKAGDCNWSELRAFVLACTICGNLHLCREELCRERQLDCSSKLLVCPISGRCFNRMLTEREEEEEGGGGNNNDDDGNGNGVGDGGNGGGSSSAADWNAEEGMGGRLGRAFYAGYNADAKELQHRFGIRF